MGRVHVVVDGSNIATEGRTAPSLAQLDDAVRSFIEQYGYEKVTVIVDATFGHRIDASESAAFEEAILAGELVTPPAGTIGRGDAFILQVARLADADVLSNDSFQELHAEHPWLFEDGRLWGGKPVPAVGWVFVARAPVRGVTSRRVVQAAKRAKAGDPKAPSAKPPRAKPAATKPAARATPDTPAKPPAATRRAKQSADEIQAAAEAVDAASAEASGGRRKRRRGGGGGGGGDKRDPINEQLTYAAFVVEHPIGTTVVGEVERFSSHGAYVRVDGALGYVPLRELGDPPPRSAREVLSLGEQRDFIVTRFDPNLRGIDVVPADADAVTTSTTDAGPAAADEEAATATTAAVSSEPDAEEAPVSPAAKKTATRKKAAGRKATAKKASAKKATKKAAPARKTAAKKAAAKRAPAKKKAVAKKATARTPAAKKATAKKATAKKATVRKATAKKAGVKRATKKAAARKRA